MTDLDTKPKSETRTAPAKRWINRWVVVNAETSHIFQCHICGRRWVHRYGDILQSHCRRYPSKDVAESHASKLSASDIPTPDGKCGTEYLGAFPVEEGE